MKALRLLFMMVVLLFGVSTFAADTSSLPQNLASISVTIDTEWNAGSGVVFQRKDAKGNDVTFIWTVAHVTHHEEDLDTTNSPTNSLNSLKVSTNIMDITNMTLFDLLGPERPTKEVDTTNYSICQDVNIDGKFAYKTNISAKLFKHSFETNGEDLALLIVPGKFFNSNTVVFDLSGHIPQLGEPLVSVSSPYEQDRCYSTGMYSGIGRVHNETMLDQTTIISFPGSSGGGVYTPDGKCVGLIDKVRGPNMSYIVPVRRMQEWVKREHIEWAMDPTVPMPSDLKSVPVNDAHPLPVKKMDDDE